MGPRQARPRPGLSAVPGDSSSLSKGGVWPKPSPNVLVLLVSWSQSLERPVCQWLLFRVAFSSAVHTFTSAGHLRAPGKGWSQGALSRLPRGTAGSGGCWFEIREAGGGAGTNGLKMDTLPREAAAASAGQTASSTHSAHLLAQSSGQNRAA